MIQWTKKILFIKKKNAILKFLDLWNYRKQWKEFPCRKNVENKNEKQICNLKKQVDGERNEN